MDGATATCNWTPVQDPFYSKFTYQLEYKKSTESAYTRIQTKMNVLSKTITNLLATTTYNFRVRAKLDVNIVTRTMAIGATRTMAIGASRTITPTTKETQYSAYSSIITLTTTANNYILGYNNEIIEIPCVYSEDIEDDIAQTQTVLSGNKIRWTNAAAKYKINIKTRPIEYAKYMKIYGFIKSRLNQAETIYINDLKKRITAYIDVKVSRFNNSLYELDLSIEEA